MYLPSYCIGIWLAGREVRWSKLLLIGFAAACPALAFSFLPDTAIVEKSMWSMPWALAGSTALFGAVMHFDRHLPRSAWVLTVTQASYFLYLLHRPIYAVFLKICDAPYWLERAVLLIFVALPCAILLAWAGQLIYDRLWNRAIARPRAFRQDMA